MLLERDVVRFEGAGPRSYRVVWADQREVWLFDLNAPSTAFSRWGRADLEARLDSRDVIILTDHGHDARRLASALSDAQTKRRDEMMKVIAPLVARAPDIFDARVRGKAVGDLERAGVRSAKTVHAALDRWWRKGMSLDALVPGFDECGRGPRRPDAKRAGRKQPTGAPPGVTVTPAIERIFKEAIRRFYSNDRKNALSSAYQLMRGEFFVDELRDEASGETVYRTKPQYAETGFPTLRQFRYWYGKGPDKLGIKRKRLGASNYEKENRGTTGSASRNLLGVGARFEIDATKLELGTVSGINAGLYIDPPTFYQVTDVLTSLVCGIYVGYEEASWIGAGLAVRNVVEDKVEFARRYGVEIEPHQWPCQGVLPKRILADNAEFKGDLATEFTAKSHVTVENAEPLRGDRKGTVEGKFTQFKRELRKRLPGLVKKNHADPGEVDYRRDACLTLTQVTAAVIETVVLLNNRKLVKFNRSREMMEAGVYAVPTEMWEWALRTGASELRRFDVATAEFAMLPTATVSVTKDGIVFKRLFYAGADTRADIFARARQEGVSRLTISYDPLCTTSIYVHDRKSERGFQKFTLTGGSWEYRDVSFEDAARVMGDNEAHSKLRQFTEAEADARFSRSHGAIDREARASRSGRLTNADVAKGKKNRKAELRAEREERPSALHEGDAEVVIDSEKLFAERREQAAAKRDGPAEDSVYDWMQRLRDEPA